MNVTIIGPTPITTRFMSDPRHFDIGFGRVDLQYIRFPECRRHTSIERTSSIPMLPGHLKCLSSHFHLATLRHLVVKAFKCQRIFRSCKASPGSVHFPIYALPRYAGLIGVIMDVPGLHRLLKIDPKGQDAFEARWFRCRHPPVLLLYCRPNLMPHSRPQLFVIICFGHGRMELRNH